MSLLGHRSGSKKVRNRSVGENRKYLAQKINLKFKLMSNFRDGNGHQNYNCFKAGIGPKNYLVYLFPIFSPISEIRKSIFRCPQKLHNLCKSKHNSTNRKNSRYFLQKDLAERTGYSQNWECWRRSSGIVIGLLNSNIHRQD